MKFQLKEIVYFLNNNNYHKITKGMVIAFQKSERICDPVLTEKELSSIHKIFKYNNEVYIVTTNIDRNLPIYETKVYTLTKDECFFSAKELIDFISK